MVAITVILAAVIGTFVLGLGDSLGDSQPTAQISVEPADSTGEVRISHNGGDSLQLGDISIVDGDGNDLTDGETTNGLSGEFSVGNSGTISGGDVPNTGNEITVQLIHNPSDSIIVEETVTVP
jgi:FlaG/FlaF family flagellin (archaellin)